jgi:hypothetical protein
MTHSCFSMHQRCIILDRPLVGRDLGAWNNVAVEVAVNVGSVAGVVALYVPRDLGDRRRSA